MTGDYSEPATPHLMQQVSRFNAIVFVQAQDNVE